MVSCPTGALTNKGSLAPPSPPARCARVRSRRPSSNPCFKGVSGTFLELNRGAIVKRRYRKGEIICREGEFGSTAFYILEGKAKVSISTPMATSRHRRCQGLFKRLTSTLVAREEDKREEETRDRTIPSMPP